MHFSPAGKNCIADRFGSNGDYFGHICMLSSHNENLLDQNCMLSGDKRFYFSWAV